jgi:hypothetical protein
MRQKKFGIRTKEETVPVLSHIHQKKLEAIRKPAITHQRNLEFSVFILFGTVFGQLEITK